MNAQERMLNQIREAVKNYGSTDDEVFLDGRDTLEVRGPQYVPFLLRLLDEAIADRQRLIDGIQAFYDGSVQDAALSYLLEDVGVNETKCDDHNPRQHRDGKPPWCRKCGLTKDFKKPTSIFDKR